ncbi:MAG: hypothetical protein Q7N50_04360 [Armatimonadota bacterium]|nr:hypothetical protein [Armatimonadota bacterium]
MRSLGDYSVYINKCGKILALIPMGFASHRARQKQGEWYEFTASLRQIRQLRDLIGDDSLKRLGREIIPLVSRIEREVLDNLNVDSPESSLQAIPEFYARCHEECGGFTVQQLGDRKFLVEDDTPYPESLNAGLLEGAVREFGGLHVNITVSQAGEGKRRHTVIWS